MNSALVLFLLDRRIFLVPILEFFSPCLGPNIFLGPSQCKTTKAQLRHVNDAVQADHSFSFLLPMWDNIR